MIRNGRYDGAPWLPEYLVAGAYPTAQEAENLLTYLKTKFVRYLILQTITSLHVFQVESNKVLPQQGSILISSPFMNDYHFTRAVVLLIEHNDEGSMGIIMNKDFRYHILLNDLIPELEFAQRVPVYKGGPVSRETIFFLHTLKDLEGALPLGNGLYLNGDFNAVQQYILDGKPIEGVIRFFAGYAGWDHGQLAKEIKENSWLIGKAGKETLLNQHFRDLWHTSLNEMGGKYAIWARYPQYPSLN